MANQLCQFRLKQQFDSDSIETTIINNNTYNQRKKLYLTSELVGGIAQFKRMIISQKKNQKINFLDPVRRENLALDCDEAEDTKRLLRAGVSALQDVIVRERRARREYVANVAGRLDGLRSLDRAKERHACDLERFASQVDGTIGTLREAAERMHGAYEALRTRFYESFGGPGEVGGPQALCRTVERFARLCDRAVKAAAAAAAADGTLQRDDDVLATLRDDVLAALRDDVLATLRDDVQVAALRDDAERAPETTTAATERALDRNRLVAAWDAIASVHRDNLALERAAEALDGQTAELEASLSDATTGYMALDASKSGRMYRAVALDDFCAVTERMTARQIRNLEFGRMLAVDDEQIARELEKVQRLKAMITRKKNKKEKLLRETDDVRSQLDACKGRYEELERRRAFLADDLFDVQRSPNKLADQSELQFGQRAKHLRELKIHHKKLTNKRDALKLKLQKLQESVKTPSQINRLFNP